MEDWESDTKGRKTLDFNTFFDSMFELCTCYADDRTAASYIRFLTELVAGTTKKNPEGPNGKSWAFRHPTTADNKGLGLAVDRVRSLVRDLASSADPEGGVPAWLMKFGGGRTLTHGPDAGGPMNLTLAAWQASAKISFSDRKPYPGWMASAPVAAATSRMRSPRR